MANSIYDSLKKIPLPIIVLTLVVIAAAIGTVWVKFSSNSDNFDLTILIYSLISLIVAFILYQILANISLETTVASVNRSLKDKLKPIFLSYSVPHTEWYQRLYPAMQTARKARLIYHTNLPPHGGDSVRRHFFEELEKKFGDIEIDLIIRIDTDEKLGWIVDRIFDDKNKKNLFFNVRYSPINLHNEAPPVSVQIIEGDNIEATYQRGVFIFDMSKGFFDASGNDEGLISFDNPVIDQFEHYFDTYWDNLEKFYLKDGIKIRNEELLKEKNLVKFLEMMSIPENSIEIKNH